MKQRKLPAVIIYSNDAIRSLTCCSKNVRAKITADKRNLLHCQRDAHWHDKEKTQNIQDKKLSDVAVLTYTIYYHIDK